MARGTILAREKGSGAIWVREDAAGRGTYYGRVFVGGRHVKRALGRVRSPGSREGLTRVQALAALRKLSDAAGRSVPRDRRLTVAEAGRIYLEHLEVVKGRKQTTVRDYGSILNTHLVPFLAGRTIDRVEPAMVAAYVSAKMREDLAPKTVRNHVIFASGLFAFAVKRGWATANPVSSDDLPVVPHDDEIHFLTREELAALYRAADGGGDFGATDAVIYMTAAMTGLRLGELVALQWRDIDWASGSVRVRRAYTRGAFTTPKSVKGSRAVPLVDTIAGALERHHRASAFQGDGDLVFAHPSLGTVLDGSALRKRFHAALVRAEVRRVRFHDLRHSFGTAMAAAGTPMRALMAMMGHASMTTTLRYADYSPDPSGGAVWARKAFGEEIRGADRGAELSETERTEGT